MDMQGKVFWAFSVETWKSHQWHGIPWAVPSVRGIRPCRGYRARGKRFFASKCEKKKAWKHGAIEQPRKRGKKKKWFHKDWQHLLNDMAKSFSKSQYQHKEKIGKEREWESPKRGKVQRFYSLSEEKSQLYPSQKCGRTPTGNCKWKGTINPNLTSVAEGRFGRMWYFWLWCCLYCHAVLCDISRPLLAVQQVALLNVIPQHLPLQCCC